MKIYFISLIIFLLYISCAKEKPKSEIITSEKIADSIVIIKNENDKIISAYRFSNGNSKKLNEKITFLPNGKIDYSNSFFLEIINNDLVLHSSYNELYPIPQKRYAEFIGWKITNDSLNNSQIIKSDTTFFREDFKIKNYNKILPPKGKVVETIFLDTLIKSKGKENETIIRTVEYEVDLRDLLIYRVNKLK